jgi:hypothetical protein
MDKSGFYAGIVKVIIARYGPTRIDCKRLQ